MKAGFYLRLALDGIRKNKRLYVPYISTCIGMVMMHYIIVFLQYSPTLSVLPGAYLINSILHLGGWMIAFFACIFLFYTNSFLIRRRKKEFGLYNILGMDKRNIGKILFWESLINTFIALSAGLILGITFSKLAELGLVNLLQSNVNYTLSVSPDAIKTCMTVFGVIFILLFLNSLWQVGFSSAISLIRSENTGEKPPKGNWILGKLGILLLSGAYYIAITVENPAAALSIFFAAVIMVIAGTYLLMIAGSVLLCRILQKNKKYYYKSNHFVSVSSMVYRMKRNGAGLASICILATMVLVMISSTASLYFGSEDAIRSRYPREITTDFVIEDMEHLSVENIDSLYNEITAVAGDFHVTPENNYGYRYIRFAGMIHEHTVETGSSIYDFGLNNLSETYDFYFIPLSDYNRMMGSEETLADNEVLISILRGSYKGSTISFVHGKTYEIKKRVNTFWGDGGALMSIVPSMAVIVPDLEESIQGLDTTLTYKWTYCFDTKSDKDTQVGLLYRLMDTLHSSDMEKYGIQSSNYDSRELHRGDFYTIYGGLFYLGIMLSIVFIFAAVLIIYYKQISEGYEDQARFEIMQKVGMTDYEIRKSINSQLLTVFFLPLAFAACHLAFAFPMIRRLLLLLNLNNWILFAATTIICIVVFGLFYTLVYRITSNAYYHIVSGPGQH